MRAFFAILVSVLLSACASSHVLIGTARPAIDPKDVKIYASPPTKFEQIAIIEASSKASIAISDQGKMNVVIMRLKEEAAALGANGILLQGIGSQSSGSIGMGNAYSTGSTSAFGTGISAGIFDKQGNAIAIYVTEP